MPQGRFARLMSTLMAVALLSASTIAGAITRLAETRRGRWRFLRRRHCRSRYHRLRIRTRSGLRWGLTRPPHASSVFPGIHELGIFSRQAAHCSGS